MQLVPLLLFWLGAPALLGYGTWKARKNGQRGVSILSGSLAVAIFALPILIYVFFWVLGVILCGPGSSVCHD
jgi:hypothetical protein